MTIRRFATFVAATTLAGAVAVPAAIGEPKAKEYRADLQALNGSGVTGTATLELDGDELTVSIDATGLEAGKLHPQHVHGFDRPRNSTCPTASADDNGDGVVSVGEGAPSYGAVRLPLTPFPVADGTGAIDYDETFEIERKGNSSRFTVEVDGEDVQLGPLQNRAIVLHGMTVGGEYVPTLPVACAQLEKP